MALTIPMTTNTYDITNWHNQFLQHYQWGLTIPMALPIPMILPIGITNTYDITNWDNQFLQHYQLGLRIPMGISIGRPMLALLFSSNILKITKFTKVDCRRNLFVPIPLSSLGMRVEGVMRGVSRNFQNSYIHGWMIYLWTKFLL